MSECIAKFGPLKTTEKTVKDKLIRKWLECHEYEDYDEQLDRLGLCLDEIMCQAIEDHLNTLSVDELVELL